MKRTKVVNQVAMVGVWTPPPEPALKKQSRWSGCCWKPGEVPAGGLIAVHSGPKSDGSFPRDRMSVECPSPRGKGFKVTEES